MDAAARTTWSHLPTDLQRHVVAKLDLPALVRLGATSRSAQALSREEATRMRAAADMFFPPGWCRTLSPRLADLGGCTHGARPLPEPSTCSFLGTGRGMAMAKELAPRSLGNFVAAAGQDAAAQCGRSTAAERCGAALQHHWGDQGLGPWLGRHQRITEGRDIQLGLSALNLTDLPRALLMLPNLVALDLAGNRLVELPGTISRLTRLEALSLSDNALVCLPTWLNALSNLTTLDVTGNRLQDVSISLGLPKLKHLRAGRNQLLGLDGRFIPPRPVDRPMLAEEFQLSELNLHENRELAALPVELKNFFNLMHVDLRGTALPASDEVLKILAIRGARPLRQHARAISRKICQANTSTM